MGCWDRRLGLETSHQDVEARARRCTVAAVFVLLTPMQAHNSHHKRPMLSAKAQYHLAIKNNHNARALARYRGQGLQREQELDAMRRAAGIGASALSNTQSGCPRNERLVLSATAV